MNTTPDTGWAKLTPGQRMELTQALMRAKTQGHNFEAREAIPHDLERVLGKKEIERDLLIAAIDAGKITLTPRVAKTLNHLVLMIEMYA